MHCIDIRWRWNVMIIFSYTVAYRLEYGNKKRRQGCCFFPLICVKVPAIWKDRLCWVDSVCLFVWALNMLWQQVYVTMLRLLRLNNMTCEREWEERERGGGWGPEKQIPLWPSCRRLMFRVLLLLLLYTVCILVGFWVMWQLPKVESHLNAKCGGLWVTRPILRVFFFLKWSPL